MPDATPSPLDAALERANRHRHQGDIFRACAGRSGNPEYWLNRASVSYALAQVIMLSMKEGNGHA